MVYKCKVVFIRLECLLAEYGKKEGEEKESGEKEVLSDVWQYACWQGGDGVPVRAVHVAFSKAGDA